MTSDKFISTWKNNSLSERGGAQPHFEDLCLLLNVDPPRESDDYCYEQGLKKVGGSQGFADVWKRGCFAWENKGPEKNLGPALMQLKNYADALDNPKMLVVCNRERIELHPRFNGYPSTPQVILLENIGRAENIQTLRWLFSTNTIDKLRPHKSNAAITKDAAADFAAVAEAMRKRGLDNQTVAHFLIQCIFCMYAEDEGLLHKGQTDDPQIFSSILRSVRDDGERARNRITSLFSAMQSGGQYGNDDIAWFNGGLFKTIDVPPLQPEDITALRNAAENLDWRAIDPTIFGTLFERGLDPDARAPLGAHYTDVETINKLIRPLIVEPFTTEWESALPLLKKAQGKGLRSGPYKAAKGAIQAYLEKLKKFRVLDPACGSGNFLYLVMRALKDLEHTAQIDAELMGFGRQISIETGPENVLGLEINEYAAELARITVWIGDIQWSQSNGRPIADNPILRSLDGIEHRDALVSASGEEAPWPDADVIVGNPPFLGDRKMIRQLGENYTYALRKLYAGKVSGGADLVCYWFYKAHLQVVTGKALRAGFVATNSIRGGANRKVLDAITNDLVIFNAWSDEGWINDGAAVRVSLVSFVSENSDFGVPSLNGIPVPSINADLTASLDSINRLDLTTARRLVENEGASFIGTQKNGPFDISGSVARAWLSLPNPNGRSNSDIVRPWANGSDITRRPSDTWVIDFNKMSEEEASLYEQPFEHVVNLVKPTRLHLRREWHRTHWWCHGDTRPSMKRNLSQLKRCILSPRVSKYRVFAWFSSVIVPDSAVVAIARADDATFGILQSRFHELWSLRLGTALEDRPRYTPSTTFETYPFPEGLTPADTVGQPFRNGELQIPSVHTDRIPIATTIAVAAHRLDTLRNNWLNPLEWVDLIPEVIAGYPDRSVAKPEHASELKKHTLTNLYNARPAWLDLAHKALDKAVADAYGWHDYTHDMTDNEVLSRLLVLNHGRVAK